jgi:hypothetical protein
VHENAYLSYQIFWGPEIEGIVILYVYNEIYSNLNFRPFNNKIMYPLDVVSKRLELCTKQKHILINTLYVPYYKRFLKT